MQYHPSIYKTLSKNALLAVLLASLIGCGGSNNGGKNSSSSLPVTSSSSSLSSSSSSSAISYNLTYTADSGGSISGQSSQSIDAGNSGSSVTAIPNTNYRFAGWNDGSLEATRIDHNIQQHTNLTAKFVTAGLWSTTPHSGQMALEILGPHSINITWEDNEPRTVLVSTRNDVDTTIDDNAGVNWHINVTSPFKLQNLEVNQPIYVALKRDDVITAWSSGTPKKLHTDGVINSVELGEDGTRFIAGNFSYVGPVYSNLVLLPKSTKKAYPLAFPEIGHRHDIHTIEGDGKGGWYVGLPTSLKHINTQGEISTWDAPLKLEQSESIDKLVVKNDTIYSFHSPSISFIGNSLSLTAFKYGNTEPLFSRQFGRLGSYEANAMVTTENRLYVGGSFPDVDGLPRKNLAAFSLTGELLEWSPLEDFIVNAMVVAENRIFVARRCDIEAINGLDPVPCTLGSLGIYDHEGNEIIPETYIKGEIKHIQTDGEYIYATGTIRQSETTETYTVVRFDKNGKLIPLEEILETNANDAILVHDQVLYFSADGKTGKGLKAYSLKDKVLLPWNPGTSAGASHIAASGETILTLAPSRVIGGQARHSLAKIDHNDQLLDWAPAVNGEIKTTALHDDILYIGGQFILETENDLRYNAASFNANGEVTAWKPSIETTSPGVPWGFNDEPIIESIRIKNDIVYVAGKFHTQSDDINLLRHITAFDQHDNMLNWRAPLNTQTVRVNHVALTNEHVYFVSDVRIDGGLTRQTLSITSQTNPVSTFEIDIPAGVVIKSLTADDNNAYAIGLREKSNEVHLFKLSNQVIERYSQIPHLHSGCYFGEPAFSLTGASVTYKSMLFWGERDICEERSGLMLYFGNTANKTAYEGMKEVSALNIRNDQLIASGRPGGIWEFLHEGSENIYTYKMYDLTPYVEEQ